MENKYYNDAIIGNKNIKATFSKKGELLRFCYPTVDFKQFIDFFYTGVKINESGIIYLHDDVNNVYSQYYTKDTNILNTEIENRYFNLKIRQIDYVMIKENMIIKKYLIKNNNKIDLNVDFLVYSKLLSNYNNRVSARKIDNGIVQYTHDYIFTIFSDRDINGHRINDSVNYIRSGVINDKDYIGQSADSSISYKVGVLKPGEEKELSIYIYINSNDGFNNLDDIEEKINKLNKTDTEKEYEYVKKYWRKYLDEHNKISVSNLDLDNIENVNEIYKRSILLFPLLQNEDTGGIVASMEVDENITQCSRYSYCWIRDGVFITNALDKIGMEKETEKFYKNFCKNTQLKNGMWEQRFYSDTKLAPCWGYQIDETATVIYGVYQHYQHTQDVKFLYDNLKMCENAIQFLFRYLRFIFNEQDQDEDIVKKEIENSVKEKTDKIYERKSYDLWEETEGIHLYSLCSIYSAFNTMKKIYDITKVKYENNRLKLEQISKINQKMLKEIQKIKEYIENNLIDKNTKVLYRNAEDKKTDISILGSVIPFNVYQANDKIILNTIEKINLTLRTYTGGYLRYEKDHYRNGVNPWSISTLWMALYYIKSGETKKAIECINFITNSASNLGFIGEQIDNETMKPSWVIGLGWAHAMYINVLSELEKKGIKNNGKE